jgi:ElaB/YqjD/DUF883 family membrane-anchored ribosome-binding protein
MGGLPATTMSVMKSTMKNEGISEQVNQAVEQGKELYNQALEKTWEGARAADEMVHRHAYHTLVAGVVVGFLAGFLASRGCRCCAS